MSSEDTVFIHGRPTPHPIHTKIGKAANADFRFVDEIMRWHDLHNPGIYRYISWIANALFFKDRKKYKVFFSEGLHVLPVLLTKMKFLSRQQKTVALLANEVLFFIHEGKYSALTQKVNKYLLNNYDYLFCIGQFQFDLASNLVTNKNVKIYKIFNGVPEEKINDLSSITPALDSNNILFIANGPSDWRSWYKGLDLMLAAFDLVQEDFPESEFTIVGEWDSTEIEVQLKNISDAGKSKINFVGKTNKIDPWIEQSAIYIHCARGDAFPTTVLECMASGLPVIISNITGTFEIVSKVDTNLIVEPEINAISNAIKNYLKLPIDKKHELSLKCREVIKDYSEEKALSDFKTKFQEVFNK